MIKVRFFIVYIILAANALTKAQNDFEQNISFSKLK